MTGSYPDREGDRDHRPGHRRRVAVVGGGLAGLTAALDAADAGADVVVLESRPRLGGATWSFRQHDLWFDNGQHVFLRCCTAYLGFLRRLGVSGQVHLQDGLDIPVVAPGGIRSHLRRSRGLPAPLHLASSLARFRHIGLGDRARLGRAVLALRRLADGQGEDETFAGWLSAHGQRPAAIERLWDLITLPTVNLPAAEASLAVAAFVFRTGLLEEATAADLGWARVPLGRLHADAARAALHAAGARVDLGRAVHAVRPTPDGVELATDTGIVEADAVVVAVPHTAAAGVLPPGTLARQDELDALGTSPIVNVNVIYDRPVMSEPVLAAVGSPVQWVFDHTEAAGLGTGQALTVSLSAARTELATPSPRLATSVVAALADLLPAAAGARVLHTVVSREGSATFRAAPGAGALRPGPDTRHPRITLAGAWTATGWPATMEGAVRSGHAAAARALRIIGTPTRAPLEVPA